jgi:hypothetical protein
MSPRYYLFTTILVVTFTLVISWWKQKRKAHEIFLVMLKVVFVLIIIVIGTVGVARLLAYFGIAQSGFFL